jgi:hypothetical protein
MRDRSEHSRRRLGHTIVAALMIAFGVAEIVTGVTHEFAGVVTTHARAATWAGVAIGALYVGAGVLVLTRRRRAAALAVLALAGDVAGRAAMVAAGLYPMHSARQAFAIALGTAIVIAFAIYITATRRSFV